MVYRSLEKNLFKAWSKCRFPCLISPLGYISDVDIKFDLPSPTPRVTLFRRFNNNEPSLARPLHNPHHTCPSPSRQILPWQNIHLLARKAPTNLTKLHREIWQRHRSPNERYCREPSRGIWRGRHAFRGKWMGS